MTVAQDFDFENIQHLVLEDVSWDFYERLLEEIGDRNLFVTYDQGRLEIMSPLPKHGRYGAWIGRLIEAMCDVRDIYIEPFSNTTFKSHLKLKGLEPDECYYVQHAEQASGMLEAFDPLKDPPPDLAIEVDITSRSIEREPIYAALAVPELWRFDGVRLHVRHLDASGKYSAQNHSLAFPFLPIDTFEKFVLRMLDRPQAAIKEFKAWIKTL